MHFDIYTMVFMMQAVFGLPENYELWARLEQEFKDANLKAPFDIAHHEKLQGSPRGWAQMTIQIGYKDEKICYKYDICRHMIAAFQTVLGRSIRTNIIRLGGNEYTFLISKQL
jgi:hypothetical protein